MADVTISDLSPLSVSSGLLLPVSNGTSTGRVSIANINSLAPVQSVAGRTGAVVLTKTDVGLPNVTNNAQLKIESNLSDLNSAGTARANLGIDLRFLAWTRFIGDTAGTNPFTCTQLNNSGVTSVIRTATGMFQINLANSYSYTTPLLASGGRSAGSSADAGYGPFVKWGHTSGSGNVAYVGTQGTGGVINWNTVNFYVLGG